MSASNQASTGAFSVRTMLVMVLVGVVSLAGISLISAFEPELRSGNDGEAHALSKSSVGFLALTQFLEKADFYVERDRDGIDDDLNAFSTVVITPTFSTSGEQILDYFREGPTIIILPKWFSQPDPNKRGWVNLAATIDQKETLDILPANMNKDALIVQAQGTRTYQLVYNNVATGTSKSFGNSASIRSLRVISGKNFEPVLIVPNVGAVIAKYKESNVYVVSDPDLLNNAGIANLNQARMADAFFLDIMHEEDEGPLVFDLSLNGFQRKPNLGRLFVQPPLLGATLCMVLTAIMLALQAAVRFLPPREATRVVALGKRALADNTAGLIRMGRREHRMGLPYANMIKRSVVKAVGAPATLDPVAQTAMLDRVSELSNSHLRLSVLMGEAGGVTNPSDLVKVASDLHRWKQETTRERQ
jgi:hypothetical protein